MSYFGVLNDKKFLYGIFLSLMSWVWRHSMLTRWLCVFVWMQHVHDSIQLMHAVCWTQTRYYLQGLNFLVEEEQMSWNFFVNNEIKIIVLLKTTDDLILLISIKLSTTYIMNIQVRSTKWTLYFVLIKCLTATCVILYLYSISLHTNLSH